MTNQFTTKDLIFNKKQVLEINERNFIYTENMHVNSIQKSKLCVLAIAEEKNEDILELEKGMLLKIRKVTTL